MNNDGELKLAIAAFLGGLLIMMVSLGAFLILVGSSGHEDREVTIREIIGRQLEVEPPRCLDPDACLEPSPELVERYSDPTSCDWYTLHICIVPLGDVPVDLIEHLVDYYETEYGLRISVLRPITLKPELDTERPGQVEARALREYFFTEYFVYDQYEDAILIGLTSIDIYTADRPEWRWFFGSTYGFANQDRPRQAIISTYRMDPLAWGEPADDEIRNRRVRTMMNKYVALTYYGLELNNDPHSVLYRQISSLRDLDRIDERIPIE